MNLVADTGALFALFDADDRNHVSVREVLAAETRPPIVPFAVIPEIDYLLREHLGIDAELTFIDNLRSGALALDLPPHEDLERVRVLLEQYRGLDLGFVDAAVIATAERLGVNRLLTLDQRDFRAVSPASGTPFTLLPADR